MFDRSCKDATDPNRLGGVWGLDSPAVSRAFGCKDIWTFRIFLMSLHPDPLVGMGRRGVSSFGLFASCALFSATLCRTHMTFQQASMNKNTQEVTGLSDPVPTSVRCLCSGIGCSKRMRSGISLKRSQNGSLRVAAAWRDRKRSIDELL